MKFKKLILAATTLLAVGALAGCKGNDPTPSTDPSADPSIGPSLNPSEEPSEDPSIEPSEEEESVHDEGDLVDVGYKLAAPGELKEGYNSLANQHANSPLNKDGTYLAGGETYSIKDVLKTTYATEPDDSFFNYLINTWTYNSYHYCNMVDGLVENDKYGNIVGDMALGYKLSYFDEDVIEYADDDEDQENPINVTKTREKWTFQLRENGEWVSNETGKKVADVTAADFVSGIKYVLNPSNASGTVSLTYYIKGAEEYFNKYSDYLDYIADPEAWAADPEHQGEPVPTMPDFSKVGVKAIDDYTLEYTLETPTPFFLSMLTYSPFLPVNEEFVEEQGTDFGATVNNILVNGAFRITEHSFQDKMVYAKNYHYFDRDHVYVKHVERKFVAGTATLDTTRTWFEAGIIDSFTVKPDDETGWANYVAGPDGTGDLKNPYAPNCNSIQQYGDATYVGYFNFNRTFYEYEGGLSKSDAQKRDAAQAVLNANFRKGFLYGLDVLQYLKRFSVDEPENYLMRSFTNKDLASAGGKDYTEYVTEVYNREQGTDIKSLVGIDNGGDPIYSPEKAAQFFEAAYNDLKDSVSSFPIYIDYIGSMNAQLQVREQDMLNAVMENSKITANGDEIQVLQINYNIPTSSAQNTQWGSVKDNFDFSMWSGWGPDYADPNTFLHCYCIYGDMLKHNGLPTNVSELATKPLGEFLPQKYQDLVVTKTVEGIEVKDYSKAIAALQEDALGNYNALYEQGAAIIDPEQIVERFEKFAEAEYDLIYGEAIIVPWYSESGYYASVSRTIPWQAGRATYGLTGDKFKNVVAINEAITKAERQAITDEYNAGK